MAQATATGTLGGTPIPNLLVYCLDRRLTGTLVVEDHRHRKSAVGLVDGVTTKVKLPEEIARLSEILAESGVLPAERGEETFSQARAAGQLHGRWLVEQGLATSADVDDALGEQIGRKVEWLCTLRPESVYGYYEGQDFLAGYGTKEGARVDPLALVWRVVRAHAEPAPMDAMLARLGDRELRLHARARPGRFGFDARERSVVDVLRLKPQSMASLVAEGLLAGPQIAQVLYTLLITRQLDLATGTEPVGLDSGLAASTVSPPGSVRATTAPRSAVPRRPSSVVPEPVPAAETEAFRKEIQERIEGMGSRNYYEILGVDRAASAAAIRTAFFQLAKKWHPDRIGPELADVREAATRVFSRMAEAHQMLTDDEQRKEYERLMKEGGSTADEQEMVHRVLRAASAFQRAEILAKRGNLEEATRQARSASEEDPEQAEYTALYAELLSQSPDRQQSGNFADVIKMVNAARKKEPQNRKVWLYRARVLKRAGDADGAYREYRKIVAEEAGHVEAAREVRLHEMRRGKGSTTDPRKTGPRPSQGKGGEPAGLFGKFFKR